MTSRVLGLVREQVMAYLFGAGNAVDAFYVAFRIPNLMRDLFAEGALSSAFVPTFTRYLRNDGRAAAWRLGSNVLNALALVTGTLVLAGILAAEPLVGVLAGRFAEVPGKFELTVQLTRIMLPFLTLASLAAACMGMLNALDRYFVPAFAPAVFNIASITTTLALIPVLNWLGLPLIYAMALGVIAGGLGQVLVQWPSLRREGFRHTAVLDPSEPGLRQVLFLMGPGTLGLADRLLLHQLAPHLGAFPQRAADQQGGPGEHGEQHVPRLDAVRCEEQQRHVRDRGGRPHEQQRPPPLAEPQGEAGRGVGDDHRGRERPQQVLGEADAAQDQRPGHVGGEHHGPGRQRPYDGEEHRRDLRHRQQSAETSGQVVEVGEQNAGGRQQEDAQRERGDRGQQPHPPARRARNQRTRTGHLHRGHGHSLEAGRACAGAGPGLCPPPPSHVRLRGGRHRLIRAHPHTGASLSPLAPGRTIPRGRRLEEGRPPRLHTGEPDRRDTGVGGAGTERTAR